MADWPGPPARYTTRSLSGTAESLFRTASLRSILRDRGSARFSGTGNFVQKAGVVAEELSCFSSHAVSMRLPTFRVAGGAALTGLAGAGVEAADAGAPVSAPGPMEPFCAWCLPHHCQPSTPATITIATMRMIMREFI